MLRTGRPKSTNYEDLGFEVLKKEKKLFAYCNTCNQTLQNTAISRLQGHRKRCHAQSSEQMSLSSDSNETILSDCTNATSADENRMFIEILGMVDTGVPTDANTIAVSDQLMEILNTTQVNHNSEGNDGISLSGIPNYLPCKDSDSDRAPSANSNCRTPTFPSSSTSSASFSNSTPQSGFSFPVPKSTSDTTEKHKKKKSTLSNFVDAVSLKEQKELDMVVAKFFYGCNISLCKIESLHFRTMIKKLRPAYSDVIPGRKALSTKMLDEVYDFCLNEARSVLSPISVLIIDGWKNSSSNSKTVVSMIHNALNSKNPRGKALSTKMLDEVYDFCLNEARSVLSPISVLIIDGWKNSSSNSKTVVSMIHNALNSKNPRGSFVNAWDLSGEPETADRISDIVIESIDLVKKLYGTDVYAVISDNASVMVKMGKDLNHIIWHSTCNCHTGNLLAKDVIDTKLAENVNSILKEFKKVDFEKSILDKGGKKIKMACETRWCSNRDACISLLSNLQQMKQIIIDENPKKVKSNITKLVLDEEFIETVKEEKEMLDPICQLINKCQDQNTTLADAAQMWLSFDLKNKYRGKMLEKFEKRKKTALNKYALVAYYLHPFYDNALLASNSDYMKEISHFLLQNLNAGGLEDWHLYKIKGGIFELLYSKEIKKPEIFWSTAEINHPQLSKLALKVLNLPASSAQIERVFSNWGQIHTPLRNRLTFERSKKLMHIYFSLNNTQQSFSSLEMDDDED